MSVAMTRPIMTQPIRTQFILALRLARRELRVGVRKFRIFLACLFLGTAIIAGVGSVTANISEGLREESRVFLGGDVELRQVQEELPLEVYEDLSTYGTISRIATLRAMVHLAENGREDSSLVELKVVDELYPLFGHLKLRPHIARQDLFRAQKGRPALVISEALANRLSVAPGDHLKLGDSIFYIAAISLHEPDNDRGFRLAPGAMLSFEGLEQSGLVQPGSLIRYYYRLRLEDGFSPEKVKKELNEKYPDATWRLRISNEGGAGIRQFVTRLGQFMTLVGLTALLVGGVGVSNAVAAYLGQKTDTIATFKILGAPSRLIFMTYLTQVLIMAGRAILAGLVAGAITPLLISDLLGQHIPVPLKNTVYVKPLLLAVFYSLLITLIFTLWPLSQARDVPAARLFRQLVNHQEPVRTPKRLMGLIGGLAGLLLAGILYTADYRMLTIWFIAGAVGAFMLLFAAGGLARAVARRLHRVRRPAWRIALANIHRPGNATMSIILSLGLGLTLFSAIALVRYNITREIDDRALKDAPSFFFIDIQKPDEERFQRFLTGLEGVRLYRSVPNLRGRITHVKGIPVGEVDVHPDGRWMLRGDRGLTFTAKRPEDNDLVAGQWWGADYQGPPQLSISHDMADYMKLGLGDEVTVNVLGRSITAEIVSIRKVDWGSFGINYVLMFDPATLKAAPYTYVATARVTPNQEEAVFRAIARAFPQVSVVRMTEVLNNVQDLLRKIGSAIDVMAAITILTGVLVLAGAVAAGHKGRIYDAAVLKVVGATRRDILKAYLLEFLFLGSVTGLIALGLGALAAYGIVTGLMQMSWQFSLTVPVLTITLGILFTLLAGMTSIWLALAIRPARLLRNV